MGLVFSCFQPNNKLRPLDVYLTIHIYIFIHTDSLLFCTLYNIPHSVNRVFCQTCMPHQVGIFCLARLRLVAENCILRTGRQWQESADPLVSCRSRRHITIVCVRVCRGGHFRYFLIFSLITNDFFAFLSS